MKFLPVQVNWVMRQNVSERKAMMDGGEGMRGWKLKIRSDYCYWE